MKIDLKKYRKIATIQFVLFLLFVVVYALVVQAVNRYLIIWCMETAYFGLSAVIFHVIVRRRERRGLPRAFARQRTL